VDKLVRFTLLPREDDPILWDFGSAARHHQLYNPWLGERSRAGISTLRGAYPERAQDVARKIRVELEARNLHRAPLGVDVIEIPVLDALKAEGITVVDGQGLMQEVRKLKTQDEITLLATSCMMVDAAYEELYRVMRPGMRENECVALVNKVLYEMGSEHVEGVNAISGERCSPHPHVYTDRVPDLLLPDLCDRQRLAGPGRRLQTVSRLSGCGDQSRETGGEYGRRGQSVA
jgi:Xaa-Pro aminopeptidase